MVESIDKIRRNEIPEIKEEIKRNPKYLNPANKKRSEDMKRLMFVSGNEFIQWMQNNGIMVNTTDIERDVRKRTTKNAGFNTEHDMRKRTIKNAGCNTNKEYMDKLAQDAGFKDRNERQNELRHENGICLPKEFNEDCSDWFGDFTENLMIHYYPGAIKMSPKNPGFDYLWNMIKIDNKGRCLSYPFGGNPRCIFPIRWNNIADQFICSGWDNSESLNPLFALKFKKNDLVRIGKGKNAPKVEFWKREGISITYTPEGLEQFEDCHIDIEWLKESRNRDKDK